MSNNQTINLHPATFSESLQQLNLAAARSRNSYYLMIASTYAAFVTGFSAKSETELKRNVSILNKALDEAKIEYSDSDDCYKKLAMLALGSARSPQLYDVVHVLKVAEKHSKKSVDIVSWLEEKGVQGIRRAFNADGSEREAKKKNKSSQVARVVDMARQELHIVDGIFTFPNESIQPVGATDFESECTALIVRQPDGRIVVKAIINNKSVTEAALVAFYKDKARNVWPKQEAISKVLESDQFHLTDVREKLGDKVAELCKQRWEDVKARYADYDELPSSLQEYVDMLKVGKMQYGRNGSKGESLLQDALKHLGQSLEEDGSLAHYLDRDYSEDIDPNPESMPHLRSSKSPDNQAPDVRPKQQDVYKQVLRSLLGTHELTASESVDPIQFKGYSLLSMARKHRMA